MGVVVDSKLVNRVVALSGERTIKAAVTKALVEFISRRQDEKQRTLLNKAQLSIAPRGERSRRPR